MITLNYYTGGKHPNNLVAIEHWNDKDEYDEWQSCAVLHRLYKKMIVCWCEETNTEVAHS